jgi:hypothetical protein
MPPAIMPRHRSKRTGGNTLADQLRIFTDLNTPPSHVVIFDFHAETNTFVVLAQTRTSASAPKNRPAFFRHRPGYIPQLEANALARYLSKKHQGSGLAIMA